MTSTSRRFVLPVALALAGIAAVWGAAATRIALDAAALEATSERALEALRSSGRLARRSADIGAALYALRAPANAAAIAAIRQDGAELDALFATYARAAGDQASAALVERAARRHARSALARDEAVAAIESGDARAAKVALARWISAERWTSASLRDLSGHAALRLNRLVEASRERQWIALRWSAAAFAFAAFAAVGLVAASGRRVEARLERLRHDLVEASRAGRLHVPPAHEHGNDHIAILARSLNDAGALLAHRTRERDGLNAQLTERLRERDEAVRGLEAFTGRVSHDLRAPARAIEGHLGLLDEQMAASDPAVARHHLRRARENARRMSEMIDGMMRLARAGTQPLALRTTSVAGQVHEALRLILGPGEPSPVVILDDLGSYDVDPALMRQVWTNLLGNAIKFSSGVAAPCIEVGTGAAADGGRSYFVRDDGVGFDPTRRDRLFTAFTRLHDDSYAGLGIGLAIVESIVRRHGGSTWAQPNQPRGAIFGFTLPPSSRNGDAHHPR